MIQTIKRPLLISILELGGYPDFTKLYQSLGYDVFILESMRKAIKFIKNNAVDVVVAEFNFQSDFRDRTSQLESLMASLAQKPEIRVIIFYDKDQAHQFAKLTKNFQFYSTLAYPVIEADLMRAIPVIE
jgi:DNA-binding NtrC family response regulator